MTDENTQDISLQDRLLLDLQRAMRERDVTRRQMLRLVRSAIVNAEIEKGGKLTESEVLQLITKEAKLQKDNAIQYHLLGREDLVAESELQTAILEAYLPRTLARSEIESMARIVIGHLSESGAPKLKEVMGHLMPQVRGRADGNLVYSVVSELLASDQQH